MRAEVYPSIESDCAELLARATEADRADMVRGWGVPMEEGLRLSFEASAPDERWTIAKDGEVAGMFGCTPEGNVWLMRTGAFDALALRFIRRSKPYIDAMVERHGEIRGFASVEHDRLMRWLAWAGFEITDLGNGYFMCVKRTKKAVR